MSQSPNFHHTNIRDAFIVWLRVHVTFYFRETCHGHFKIFLNTAFAMLPRIFKYKILLLNAQPGACFLDHAVAHRY